MSASHLTLLTGASRGMGRAMAEQLLDAGHTLVCISRKTDEALAAKAKQSGATLLQWSFDLAAPEAAAQRVGAWLAEQDAKAFDSVTLINNAGTVGRLDSPATAAGKVLAYLARADVGAKPVADVRDAD
jgi:NAD(P)-dependent dehydrogenase (short-subunit alcohol dehydrogenase family)